VNFRRLEYQIAVEPLLDAIKEPMWHADLYWKNHPVPVFRNVDSIILRFPHKMPYFVATKEEQDRLMASVDPWECADQPCFDELPQARDIAFDLMAKLRGERLGRILINRLPSGQHIPSHSDIAADLRYYDRFHIPLTTNDGIDFRAGEDHAQMGVGEIWWFDNSAEHEVWNRGNTDRIHLIVDIRTGKTRQ
jgi:hypothetical protein